jgi:hypothetical protein
LRLLATPALLFQRPRALGDADLEIGTALRQDGLGP